jgi:hypothetical protein
MDGRGGRKTVSTLSVNIMSDAEEVFTKIDQAVMEAVETTMRRGLLDEIQSKALSEVYSYGATEWAESKRRYTIGDERVMNIVAGGGGGNFYLEITNNAFTQSPGGADESDIVEEGYANYRQPGPRPFMQPALDEYIASGRAEADLNTVLSS